MNGKRRGRGSGNPYVKFRTLSYFAFGLIGCLLITNQPIDGRELNKVTVSGWTEVGRNWPAEKTSGFFVATEKYHHFIEIKVPNNLAGNLKVKLRYFYNFAQVRPIFEVVPCNKRIDIFANNEDHLPKGQWLDHEIEVRAGDCERRPELAYHVLLHNKGDVFAWNSLEISTILPEQPSTTTTLAPGSDDKTTDSSSSDELKDEDFFGPGGSTSTTSSDVSLRLETTTTLPSTSTEIGTSTSAPTFTWSTSTTKPLTTTTTATQASTSTTYPTSPTTIPTTLPTSTPLATTTSSTTTTTTTITTTTTTPKPTTTSLPTTTTSTSTTTTPSPITPTTPRVEQDSAPSSTSKPGRFTFDPLSSNSPQPTPSRDSNGERVNPNEQTNPDLEEPKNSRFRRSRLSFADTNDDSKVEHERKTTTAPWVPTTTSAPKKVFRAKCTPRSCNRNQIKFNRFATIFDGLPTVSSEAKDGGSKMLVSSMKPLKLELESADESFAELDACLNLSLFMEPGTSFNLTLRDSNPDSRVRIMETVRRRREDLSASRWEQFNRCVSDYLPVMQFSGPEKHVLEFQLVPNEMPAGKQIVVLFHPKKSAEVHDPRGSLSFLPNAAALANVEQVEDYWLVDRDGLRKPSLKFEPQETGVVAGSSANPLASEDRRLVIENIDPTQESFDLTSRWLRLHDAELYEDPIIMMYKVKSEPWIESIDVEYQNAVRSSMEWRKQNLYNKPKEATTTTTHQLEERVFPIRLFGLDSQPFRLRIRHKLSPPETQTPVVVDAKSGQPSSALENVEHRSLRISTLAFADICASGNYCQNKGLCKSTGMLTAECQCRDGFTGRHCELINACDVLVEGTRDASGRKLPGREVCALVGATCVPGLPVLRCKWPNDQYYECKSLISDDSSGSNAIDHGSGQSTETPPRADEIQMDPKQMQALKEKATQQAQLIIILVVFMIALMVFSIVLIINMITRLRKTKRRLERSQSETRDLARRSAPGISTSNFNTNSTGRNKPPAVISYNNTAFDVE